MRLFARRRESSGWGAEVPGLAELAAARGWAPVAGDPFESHLAETVHRTAWIVHGRQYNRLTAPPDGRHSTVYRDAYRGMVDGRTVTVANGWTNIGPQQIVKLYEMTPVAVCAVDLPTVLPIVLIQPRQYPLPRLTPEMSTGDASFDARFFVGGAALPGQPVLTAEVRQRISLRDDWVFVTDEYRLACVTPGRFESGEAVSRRVDEVLGLVAAFPSSVMPAHVDRSIDDLVARIDRLSTVEDAIAFLLGLTPDDRDRLARSDTPLAAFADVTTPEAAMARFESLDVQHRMQIIAMFSRVTDEEHG